MSPQNTYVLFSCSVSFNLIIIQKQQKTFKSQKSQKTFFTINLDPQI